MREFNWLLNTPIAHRGLHGNGVAENSMSAYKKAIEKGLNIEIDVHLTKDKNIAVFHDPTLTRVCGEDILIKDLTTAELKQHKLDGTKDTIPTLDELLELIDGKVGLLIEIKSKLSEDPSELCTTLVEKLKNYKGNYAIQSFSPKAVKWFRINKPCVIRGWLATNYEQSKFKKHIKFFLRIGNKLFSKRFVRQCDVDFVAYNILSLPNRTIAKIRKKGMTFLTWTVKTDDHLKLAKQHADSIIFENLEEDKYLNFYKQK